MTFHELNILPAESLKTELFGCCGSRAWVEKMLGFFPMDDLVEMLEDAEAQWYACTEADWREAFSHHPKIGDVASISGKFADSDKWAADEQRNVNTASGETIARLLSANEAYEKKFGYIFIVSAAGKTAEEMLALMEQRLTNTPQEEIGNAAEEQVKITSLRLQKLIT